MAFNLPIELWRDILETLHRNDLFNLLLTSRSLHQEAERTLYREIRLAEWHHEAQRSSLIVKELASCPRRALLVRELSFRYMSEPSLPKLAAALQQMSNLIILRAHGHQPLPSNFFVGCLFTLQSFSFTVPHDEHLVNFLVSQPSICSLTWMDESTHNLQLPSTLVPSLSMLYGTKEAVELLFPDRPITHLRVASHDVRQIISPLTPNVNLRVLVLEYQIDLEQLRLVSMSCPLLRHLECDIPVHEVNAAPETIRVLLSLQTVVFYRYDKTRDPELQDQNIYSAKLFDRIPSLNIIELGRVRWARGDSDGQPFVRDVTAWRKA